MGSQPSGRVTFLFTDVQGSTRLWASHTAAMEQALARHDELMRDVIARHHGYTFSIAGDSFGAAFESCAAAVAAALDAQTALLGDPWTELPGPLRVRMGLHAGTAQERSGNYFGPAVNLAARVMSAAWGGQILCTAAVANEIGSPTTSVGEHRLRDVDGKVALCQILTVSEEIDFPPPRTLDAVPTTVPAQRSSFIGRGPDIAIVRRLLIDHRIVTLTGPGGTGKTRLAVEIAGREQPHQDGGTFFADLAALEGADHLAAAIARACLVPVDASRAPIDELTDALGTKRVLLVLDNCEHVLDAVAEVADHVLSGCADVRVLATSREPLGITGEHVHVLAPLDTNEGSEAAQLFVERAAAAGGEAVDADDPDVQHLCELLEGVPLAIEIAAARARTASPRETIERLDRQLDLLAGARRGPGRHQTLRATISWSYDLLDDDERRMFERLAVFASSFDAAAAAHVAGLDEFDEERLHELVAKSMVDTRVDGEGRRRYRLLYSLRAYAGEQLRARGDEEAARSAHARHYLTRLGDMPPWRMVARDLWKALEPDLEDLIAAFDYAAVANDEELRAAWARATEPLSYLLTNLGLFDEARRRCEAALAAEIDGPLHGRLLIARGFIEATQDGGSNFGSYASRAVVQLEPGDGTWAGAVGMTSIVEQFVFPDQAVGQLEAARSRLDGLETTRADHDRAVLDYYLGGAVMNRRGFAEAAAIHMRSADALAEIEPTSMIRLWSAAGAAMSLTQLGRASDAQSVLDSVADTVDLTDWCADWFFAQAVALARGGDFVAATECLRPIGTRFANAPAAPMAGTIIAAFVCVAFQRGDAMRARQLLEHVAFTRAAASTALLYEVLGVLRGWSEDAFSEQKLQHMVEMTSGISDEPRSVYFESLRALLREELDRTRD